MRSVIIDGPDSWSQSLEKEGIIERFIGLDFSDAETVFERSLEAVKKAKAVRSLRHRLSLFPWLGQEHMQNNYVVF